MNISKLLALAAGRAGSPLYRSWLVGLSLSFATAVIVLIFGVTNGLEQYLNTNVLSTMPDQLRVEPAGFAAGPLSITRSLSPPKIAQLQALPGVKAVFRHARLNQPAQLYANYLNESFQSDVIVEGVDPGLVTDSLASGQRFEETNGQIPVILPRIIMDLVSFGAAVHTKLPGLSPDLIIGRHFTLAVGASSFSPTNGPVTQARCQIVGISKRVGAGGPTVPLAVLERWSTEPLEYYAATVQLQSPEDMESVQKAVSRLGLTTPEANLTKQVLAGLHWTRLSLSLLCAALVFMAATSLYIGLSLQVSRDTKRIALYRALGASRANIRQVYLLKSGLLGALGTTFGLALGLGSGWLLNAALRHNLANMSDFSLFLPTTQLFVLTWLGGLLASLLAGLIPSWRAASLPPAQALAS